MPHTRMPHLLYLLLLRVLLPLEGLLMRLLLVMKPTLPVLLEGPRWVRPGPG